MPPAGGNKYEIRSRLRSCMETLWEEANQSRPDGSGDYRRQVSPQLNRQPKVLVCRAVVRHLLFADQKYFIRKFAHLGTPVPLELERTSPLLRSAELERLETMQAGPPQMVVVHESVGANRIVGLIGTGIVGMHLAA